MTTFVLLRGWAREARHWDEFPAQLATEFPGARIETPDLPGCGVRRAEESPLHIADYVDSIRGTLAGDVRSAPFHLLGISMGGMIAIEWARRHPGDLAGGTLVNTSALPFAWPHERLRPRNYAAIAGIALHPRDAQRREQTVLGFTSNLRAHDERLLAEWTRFTQERPVQPRNVMRQLMAAAAFRAPQEPPPVPWLVLCSAADRMVDPVCSRRLAHAWQAPLREHPTAGHELTVDDGPWVARQVREVFGTA